LPDNVASPCGLIAKSYFNDKYELYNNKNFDNKYRIPIDEKGIAWPEDREKKYKAPSSDAE